MAGSGPNSRPVLAAALDDIEITNDAFPPMAVRQGHLDGIPVLVARLSFSGELAYEVYCGAHYGVAVWTRLLAAGAPFGIVPYGLEAQIGRASCRERGCQYGEISVGAVSLKKK